MKKLFTLQKGRILLLVLMLCLGFTKVQADDSGLITEQIKINVVEAGTLCDRIKSDLKYKITSLKLSGELNIDDIQYIREMAGCYYDTNGSKYDGHLKELDISDVTLIGTDKDVDVYFYTATNGSTPTGGSFLADLRTPQTLGNGLFAYLPMLRSVILPKKVQVIGWNTFLMCSQLTSVTLPPNLTTIWGYAFEGCISLPSMQFPSSLTTIYDCAFQDCTSLVSLQFPSGLTSIGHDAFYGCTSLTSLQFPSNLTSIGANAFAGCTGLTSLQFPSGLTFIGAGAFSGCTSLTSLLFSSSLTSINNCAFENCTGLTSLQFPSGLTSIGVRAFAYCSGLTSLQFPSNLTSIDDHAFAGCTGLTSLQFPSGLTSIGVRAFDNCSSLTSLELPSGLTSIGANAFYWCTGLTSIHANMSNPPLIDDEDNSPFLPDLKNNCTLYVPKDSYTAYMVAPGWGDFKTIAKFNPDLIRDWVTKNVAQAGTLSTVIGEDKENITKLKLSGNLNDTDVQYLEEMIREAVLQELDLKDAQLYAIESLRFYDCKNLTSLVLPDVLQRIEKEAFRGCTGLTTISLPAGLEYMYGTFNGCTGLTSIYANMPTPLQLYNTCFYGFDKSYCYLYVPKGSLAAYRQGEEWGRFPYIAGLEQDPATGLVSLDICPNGYRDYELIDAAMRDKVKSLKISGLVDFDFINKNLSRNLQNLDLKDANVTDLPYCGLNECQALTTISLPADLRSIDKGFLSLCSNLKTIYAYMPDPDALTYVDQFQYESKEWTLYVPKGTKNAYQNSEWRYCKEIIEMETSGIDSVILNPDAKEVSRFSADGQRLAVPVKGLNIVKYSNGSARKVVVK